MKCTDRIISVFVAVAVMAFYISFPMESSGSDEPDFNALAEEVMVLVNEARADEGLEPLYAVPHLCDIAYIRAEDTITLQDHVRPDGSSFDELIDYDIVPWLFSSENFACGMSTAEATFTQWKNSTKHWNAIMNPKFTHTGVGLVYDPDSEYQWYWIQIFVSLDSYECPSGEVEGQYLPEKYKIVPKDYGDLNGDGVIDSFDYVLLKQYLAKKTTFNSLQTDAADLYLDGGITYADASSLRKYLLGMIDKLPERLL